MKKSIVLILATAILLIGCSSGSNRNSKAVKIIFDTDLGPDYDDVGCACIPSRDGRQREKPRYWVPWLRTNMSLSHPSIEVINRYFGRGNLLIGAPKTPGVSMTASQHWARFTRGKIPSIISDLQVMFQMRWLYTERYSPHNQIVLLQ